MQMKKSYLLIILSAFLLFPMAAHAQLKFGVRAGANFTDLNLDDYKTNRAAGWFVGPTCEFIMPIVGLGLDASLLYSQEKSEILGDRWGRDYKLHNLAIPVNIKYKFPIPLIKPFIFAGPEFSFRLSDNGSSFRDYLDDVVNDKNLDAKGAEVNVNLGAGVELLNRLEVFFCYNAGLTESFKDFKSSPRLWRVGAAIYF